MNVLFVFTLIPGNKIVVNNDDNVHIVPIQCTRHPTEAHYNNPPKQYILYFRMLWIGATPTALEIMAISYHGFALFCNFRGIFLIKVRIQAACIICFFSLLRDMETWDHYWTLMTRDRFKVAHTIHWFILKKEIERYFLWMVFFLLATKPHITFVDSIFFINISKNSVISQKVYFFFIFLVFKKSNKC